MIYIKYKIIIEPVTVKNSRRIYKLFERGLALNCAYISNQLKDLHGVVLQLMVLNDWKPETTLDQSKVYVEHRFLNYLVTKINLQL